MARVRFLFALALAALAFTAPARAVQPDEMLRDPALEARARNLSRELRCMVCQNQSIDDSDAPLARDLRILVRDRLKAGDEDKQVLRSEEHTSELQSLRHLVCRLLLEKKKKNKI